MYLELLTRTSCDLEFSVSGETAFFLLRSGNQADWFYPLRDISVVPGPSAPKGNFLRALIAGPKALRHPKPTQRSSAIVPSGIEQLLGGAALSALRFRL